MIRINVLVILVLGKDFVQGLDDTTIYAEKLYSINFTQTNTKVCLSLHYNKSNGLGNISRDFSADNMKKTGLNGYVYEFNVDYDFIANDKILDIHKYLMKMNNIK